MVFLVYSNRAGCLKSVLLSLGLSVLLILALSWFNGCFAAAG